MCGEHFLLSVCFAVAASMLVGGCVEQALRLRVDGSVTSADSRLSLDHLSFKSSVDEQKTYISDTLGNLTESVKQMSDRLQAQSHDVDHFLCEELQQDMPTGSCLLLPSLAGMCVGLFDVLCWSCPLSRAS